MKTLYPSTSIDGFKLILKFTECASICPYYYTYATAAPYTCVDSCSANYIAYNNSDSVSNIKASCVTSCIPYPNTASGAMSTYILNASSRKQCVPKCGAIPEPFHSGIATGFGKVDPLNQSDNVDYRTNYYTESDGKCIKQCGHTTTTRIRFDSTTNIYHCQALCVSPNQYLLSNALNLINTQESANTATNSCVAACPSTHLYYYRNANSEVVCQEECPANMFYSVDTTISGSTARTYCVAACPSG
jgi:hypothetical protein